MQYDKETISEITHKKNLKHFGCYTNYYGKLHLTFKDFPC